MLSFFALGGDANRDKTVDLTDFTILATNFNATGKNFGQGDFNYDAKVDLTDFTILATNFNKLLPAGPTRGSATRYCNVDGDADVGHVLAEAADRGRSPVAAVRAACHPEPYSARDLG